MTLRILLVDDHAIFREALRSLLEKSPGISVVGEAGGSLEVVALVRDLRPNLVCMDIGMPGVNGVELTRQLKSIYPELKVVALSTHTDHVYVIDMMNAGASAYVTKSAGGKELLRALEAVMLGQQYLCPEIADVMTRAMFKQKANRSGFQLGERERQVLCLVAEGLNSAQIAVKLSIAASTVDVHRRNIMRKLDLHSAVDLTRYAINMGLVDR